MEKNEAASVPTAFLVDLVSNRKIPITTPRCRVGRDDLNDIVISGDQSISRFHFIITYENGQYQVQDAKSRHGTFLNGNQIGGPEPINDGDVLKIGVSLFWFVIESQAGVEKDDGLPPVDVEKKSKEESSLIKVGSGDAAYGGSQELSATQEISIVSPEALQAAGLLYKEEEELAEAAKEKAEKEEAKKEAEKAEAEKAEAEKTEAEKTEAEKAKAEKAKAKIQADKEAEKEPEIEAPKADSDDKKQEEESESAQSDDDKAKPAKEAEEPQAEAEQPEAEAEPAKEAEETQAKVEQPEAEAKPDDNDEDNEKDELKAAEESKPESKAEEEIKSEEPAEPSKDEKESEEEESSFKPEDTEARNASKSGLLHTEEIQNAVKDLLEPLTSEIEASREMIRDALKKSEPKDEEDSFDSYKDGKSEPEKASEDSSEAEPQAPDKDEEEDSDESTESKFEPPKEIKDEETTKKDEKSPEAETLEKIAEIIDDSSPKTDLAEKGDEKPAISADKIETTRPSDYDKATNGLDEDMTTVSQMGPATVPDWCKRYFSDELKHLNKELDTLNEQIKQTQDMIKKIEGQAALTKGLRNTLLTADGDDLIDACKRVLGLAGWKVTQSDEDKHEFLLEHDDEKVAIARVISIKGTAERSHLGQLSISQTRYWCEKGVEPKGVLIVGRQSDKAPKERGADANEEVTEYASSKNVCLLSTLQLLAIYRDVALKDGKSHELRSSIHDSKGWLKGLDLEPGDDTMDDEDKESTKGKSLSSLLSA